MLLNLLNFPCPTLSLLLMHIIIVFSAFTHILHKLFNAKSDFLKALESALALQASI